MCSLPYPHEQETPWGIHSYCKPPYKITLKRPFGRWRHLTTTTILPESFRFLLSWANWGFCYLILTGITKFEHERKTKWILVLVLERPHRNWVPVCLILSALKKPDSLIFLQVTQITKFSISQLTCIWRKHMPLTLKPFVITRRLIDSNSVNIQLYAMTTMLCGVTTKR